MVWIKVASFLMFLAVGLGAFGAHALKSKLSEYSLDVYKTAVLYHFIHALGLFVVAWLTTQIPQGLPAARQVNLAGIFMLAGIILFSGSLYALSLTGVKGLGAITPIGGLSFLTAWVLLFLSF
ncbi:MAG: DUF423 domain-containing protein [Candidatus Omnitrophota bacterium]